MERATLILTMLVSAGCGFQKTTPVAHVCALLSVENAATVAPGLTTATEQPPRGSADVWTRWCEYTGTGVAARVSLVVSGALTSAGAQQLADDLVHPSDPEANVGVVAGLGDKATYTAHWDYGEGLAALRGGYLVGVGKTSGSQAGEAALEPLVRSVLAQLP